ncbi:MAG: exodeoxyribonuclease VII small subunit [Planctomycetaceae bacterium]|nr:exodeoxyribonuclease VII small subunit [Planctomycetaceae bacterium]
MAKKQATPEPSRSFEDLIEETEALAEKIERGELRLDESIAAYEKGVANLRACSDLLKVAEGKVMMLLERNTGFALTELDGADNADENTDDDQNGDEKTA